MSSEGPSSDCSGEPKSVGWGARLGLLAVEAYRVTLSPLLGGYCRYYPSCSVYASEAIRRHGLKKGCGLALKRLLRCHPFHPGGVDPVP